MKFIKSFSLFEDKEIRNYDEILSIGGKELDISNLTKKQQLDIYSLISEFDTQFTEEELLNAIEVYILSLS